METQYQNFKGQDLTGTDFRGQDLTGCNFRDANLTNCDFRGAILHYANFMNANIDGAIFDESTRTLYSAWLVRIPEQAKTKGVQNADKAVGLDLVDEITQPPEEPEDEEQIATL